METCTPGALQIADGTYYEPLNFQPEDVKVEMIAHQLALKCRWNGNTNDLTEARNPVFYSVAQHACHVHDIARDHKERFVPGARWDLEPCPSGYGLHHDDSEGPLFDMPRPMKKLEEMKIFVETEDNVQFIVQQKLGIKMTGIVYECIRRIDMAILFLERDLLVGKPVAPYGNECDHPGGTLFDWVPDFEPWTPVRAKHEFLTRHASLKERGLAL